MEDTKPSVKVLEPTKSGWYTYSGGAQSMIFLLRNHFYGDDTKWMVIADDGSISTCAWGYIEQALSVYDLVPLIPEREYIHG